MNRLIGPNTDRYLKWGIGLLVAVLISLGVIHSALPAPVWAAPFLVCDPQEGVEWYIIQEGGQTDIKTPAEADGSIKYDMSSVAEGTHLWNVKACNVWGCSAPSPFGFTKSLPTGLQGARIEGE